MSPLPLPHPCWWIGGSFAICSLQGSLGSCHEWMSLWCWTPRPTADTVLTVWPVLLAWHGHSDAEGDQQLWAMHPTWRHSCQSPSVTHLCHCSFGVVACWFASNETMIELDQPPNMVNLLVFCDHFMKHLKTYVTPDQTAKTVATFLWQGHFSIFRTLAKLLSDWGANFESNNIRELCELMSIWKVRTSPYHAQTNSQVEWAHKMLMHMIGKLSKDWKADWPNHLPKLVQAYNSMRLAITRYNLHYLMFRCQLHLPIDFYFPLIRGTQKHQCVDHYISKLCEWLQEAFKEAQMQSTSEVERWK